MEERIIELELKWMHQEALLETLNDTVTSQQRLLDALKAQVESLQRRIAEPGVIEASSQERPPHY